MIELLRTKLFIPRPRKNLVARPRLVDCLNTGLDKKLTLIAAPAGFGKTTLLSEWIPQSSRCVTWLSLDNDDNDPTRFWAYFIRSLQGLRKELGEGAFSLLQSPQALPITSILTTLLNDIAVFPDAFSIVLDDYHVIESQAIHDGLDFLIEHQPDNMHLLITTRMDPPLPLSRLRARDQLTELRANDLRFTLNETTAFLNHVMGLNLSTEEVTALETRTEGWIAGLQIAALSMQGHDDVSGFVRAFSGSHRHILGYLAEEVINRQPEGTQNFLLQTSILERLCGEVCDAVMQESGGRAMLQSLEHANLFIVPLDDEGGWYRYHQLFAEVLHGRLRHAHRELIPELHHRACTWYEQNGNLTEAVNHALAAQDFDRAAQLIGKQRWFLLGRGEANMLHRWLDELPVELLRKHPELSLAYAWIRSHLEQPETIEAHLLDAEYALANSISLTSQETGEDPGTIRGEIATLRAEIALSRLDIHSAIALSRQALELLPEENTMMRGITTYYLRHAERLGGNMIEAERAYTEASNSGLQTDNMLLALHALANLSNTKITMGRLKDAAQTSQKILEISRERQRQSWPVAGLAYQGLCKLYYEWNDLDMAARYSRQGIEYGQRGGLISLEINSLSILAYTLQAQGDSSGADEILKEIAAINAQNRHPVYTSQSAAWEARLRLQQGRIDEAVRWAESCGLKIEDVDWPYSREVEYLTLARVLIAQGQLEGVEDILDRLQQAAEADERTGDLIEILIQKALYCYTANKRDHTFQFLEHALKLAEPEVFIRSFVDEGELMRLLLIDCQSKLTQKLGVAIDDSSLRLLTYTDKLLAAFSQPASAERIDEPILDPLSERELDVLRLISTGRSNQEIAELLVITLSTVKTHINRLYSKLGVKRRTEAILRARELGLLPD